MPDSNIGKKMVEEEQLHHFLAAYEAVCGDHLTVISNGERPDFICQRSSGDIVGIELARSHTITT
jgi:hypothetical protein